MIKNDLDICTYLKTDNEVLKRQLDGNYLQLKGSYFKIVIKLYNTC